MKRILIIDDDQSIAELERDFLEAEGYVCAIENDGNDGLAVATAEQWDLIIVDLMLPGVDGFAICRQLRETIDIPILMVSARSEDFDKIRGLGVGADDYITKPFNPSELTARVKAHLARYDRLLGGPARNRSIAVRGLLVDPGTHKVTRDDVDVSLTAKEFSVLLHLITNPDRVYSKEEIYERVWEGEYGDLGTVTVHIRNLRKKIEQDPSHPEYIETVWGVGYRFKA